MKKFILAFLIFAASFCALPENAWADEETYSRILAEDVTLFMDADLTMFGLSVLFCEQVAFLILPARSRKEQNECSSAASASQDPTYSSNRGKGRCLELHPQALGL